MCLPLSGPSYTYTAVIIVDMYCVVNRRHIGRVHKDSVKCIIGRKSWGM